MSEYRVVWEIDVEAESPHDAARQAFSHMQRQGTTTNCFEVYDQNGNHTQVDLLEEEEESDG